MHCWLDSTVALYWINGQKDYRQFVSNQVEENSRTQMAWMASYLNEQETCWFGNPEDITDNQLWKTAQDISVKKSENGQCFVHELIHLSSMVIRWAKR